MKLSSINRQILALAIPSIVANITTPLLALVDTAIVGHMGSAMFIAAIAVGGTLFNMIYWAFGFLRMGSSGITAQEYGRRDTRAINNILHRSLIVALCGGLLLILLQKPIIGISTMLMDTDKTTSKLVETYFYILIYGAPAVLANYSLTGWFIGMQDSRTPMWISFFINSVNITVSLILVFVFKMEIAGVAIGTLSAQWGGCLLGLILTKRHSFKITQFNPSIVFDRKEFRKFFSINFDIFLRTICLIAVTVWFTRCGATQGTIMLAVNTLLMQFFIIFSYFMDGFAFAGEAMAGKYIGANDNIGFRSVVSSLFKWSASLSIAFTCIYFIGSDYLLQLLSNDTEVIASSREYTIWAITIPLAGFAAFTWDGIFIGATLTRAMLTSMAISMLLFFITLWILFPILGNHGLWTAFIVYLFTRGAILTLLYRKKTRST